MFIAVTLVSTVLLCITYGKMTAKEFGNVMDRKWVCCGVLTGRRRFEEKSDESSSRVEAHCYALFTANLVFLVGTRLGCDA